MKNIYYAYDLQIKKRVPHVLKKDYLISLVTGSKFKMEQTKRKNRKRGNKKMVKKTQKIKQWDSKGTIEITIVRDYNKKYPLGFKEISRRSKRISTANKKKMPKLVK